MRLNVNGVLMKKRTPAKPYIKIIFFKIFCFLYKKMNPITLSLVYSRVRLNMPPGTFGENNRHSPLNKRSPLLNSR